MALEHLRIVRVDFEKQPILILKGDIREEKGPGNLKPDRYRSMGGGRTTPELEIAVGLSELDALLKALHEGRAYILAAKDGHAHDCPHCALDAAAKIGAKFEAVDEDGGYEPTREDPPDQTPDF